MKTMFDSSDGIFGHRMVHTQLAADEVTVSVGTVATIMAEIGWQARRTRAFKRTTIPGDPDKVFKDLIGRDFTAETPGNRLVGDIPYLRTNEGWLYLATVIDLCTRMIVGWAKGSALNTPVPASDDFETASNTSVIRCCFDRLNTPNTPPGS
ncbi:MAG: IS3 family transposase [Acidobacteria bacterium]|nr:IS3 family transposase [Acidobacteriota bacterium]